MFFGPISQKVEKKMNDHLRKLVHGYRVYKHLNFRELAELCGYKNSNKWATKICNFEREGHGPDDMIRRLIEALQVPVNDVKKANQKDLDNYQSWLDEPVPIELLIKPLPGVYVRDSIPDEIDSDEKAVDFAASRALLFQSESCLILSRKKSIWFNRDGTFKFEEENQDGVFQPFMSVGHKQFVLQLENRP